MNKNAWSFLRSSWFRCKLNISFDSIYTDWLYFFYRYKMYKVPINHESSEDGFNQLFVWPFLDLIGSNTNVEDCQGYFMRGEPFLESMSRQLRATGISVDEKSQYKSDGLIKLFGLKKNRSLCCLKLQAILGTLIAQKSSWIITRGCMVS